MAKANSSMKTVEQERENEVKEYIEKNGLADGLMGLLQSQLDGWKDVEINIGVTGPTGVGKSSFINAIRG